jgi:hypothetical protein
LSGAAGSARAERDRARRIRRLTLVLINGMAEHDETISGMTLVTPDGEIVFLDAAALRAGGRA